MDEPFFGGTLLADGWTYRDLPRMTPEMMELFVSIIGKDNIRWLTRASYPDGSVRGQLFVSSQGIENGKAYVAKEEQDG